MGIGAYPGVGLFVEGVVARQRILRKEIYVDFICSNWEGVQDEANNKIKKKKIGSTVY